MCKALFLDEAQHRPGVVGVSQRFSIERESSPLGLIIGVKARHAVFPVAHTEYHAEDD